MAKTVDVPTELREFNKVFNKVGGYKWDCSDVFEDFLDFMVACLSPSGDKTVAENLQKKYSNDYKYFSEMMSEMMNAYQVGTKRRNWFDGLGNYYECISSSSKAQRLGQFFTPESLCDMMTLMLMGGESLPMGKTINDPCCGSGRMLLSYHAVAPNNYFYGGDIDRICAKMTAINMCLHGLKGQAICGNALWLYEDWYFGFEVNRMLKYGFPSIEKITSEQCYQRRAFNKLLEETKEEFEANKVEIEKQKLQEKIAHKIAKQVAKTGQMSLF